MRNINQYKIFKNCIFILILNLFKRLKKISFLLKFQIFKKLKNIYLKNLNKIKVKIIFHSQ